MMNEQFFSKVFQEWNNYLSTFKTPEAAIEQAQEIAVKKEMVQILEEHQFTPAQLGVLSELERPLQTLYESWYLKGNDLKDHLVATFESYANRILEEQAVELYADPKTPRYEYLFPEARARKELHLFRASRARDRACIQAFTEGIGEANADHNLLNFVQNWVKQFGHDRCKFLLGYTVQRADWDRRYSAVSKREAAKFDYHITPERDPYIDFQTNAHPCLVNYAFELLAEKERAQQKLNEKKRLEPER